MILELPRLSCTAGTHDHAWQASRARYGHAAMAARALDWQRGCRGGGTFMRLRARVGASRPRGEAVAGRLLGYQDGCLACLGAWWSQYACWASQTWLGMVSKGR